MARPLRPSIADSHYYISLGSRGANPLFRDAADSRQFLELLAEACRRYRWSCRAYCLLPHRYHLVLHTRIASLSRGMRQLNGRYCEVYNRRHGTTGPLFRGRYKAVLFEPEAYLAPVCRDVFLAPRRAGLTEDPRAWRWSSYRRCLADDQTDWLDPGPLLAAGSAAERLPDYLGAPHDPEALWREITGQVFLGSPDFIAAIRRRLAGIPAAPRRGRDLAELTRPPLEAIAARSAAPHEAMARAYLAGGYTLAEIAHHFTVHESTVSRAVKRFEKRGEPRSAAIT